MLHLLLYAVLLVILFMLIRLTYHFRNLSKEKGDDEALLQQGKIADHKERIGLSQGYVYTLIIISIIALLLLTYFLIKGTLWEGHFMEWLNIIVRLMHITFGIAWIGASFYFVWLENALNRKENVRDELAGTASYYFIKHWCW